MDDLIFLGFGDIFCIGDQDFVYLGGTPDTVYAAKILTKSQTTQLKQLEITHAARGEKMGSMSVFSYVVLTTEQFKDRAAYLHEPTVPREAAQYQQINKDDMRQLRDAVLEGPAAGELQDLVRPLNLGD